MPQLSQFYMSLKKYLWPVFLLFDFCADFLSFATLSGVASGRGQHYKVLMNLHRLEKGLAIPSPRRNFGKEPLASLASHLNVIAEDKYLSSYTCKLLEEYRENTDSPELLKVVDHIENSVRPVGEARHINAGTTVAGEFPGCGRNYGGIISSRYSCRIFRRELVPQEVINDVMVEASHTPSVCNRQPWTLKIMTVPELKAALPLQNGNVAFREVIQQGALVLVNREAFNIIGERNQGYIDGGMFSMSVCLAFQSHGVSTCCLNWAVETRRNRKLLRALDIDPKYIVIMMIAFGYPDSDKRFAASPRQSVFYDQKRH